VQHATRGGGGASRRERWVGPTLRSGSYCSSWSGAMSCSSGREESEAMERLDLLRGFCPTAVAFGERLRRSSARPYRRLLCGGSRPSSSRLQVEGVIMRGSARTCGTKGSSGSCSEHGSSSSASCCRSGTWPCTSADAGHPNKDGPLNALRLRRNRSTRDKSSYHGRRSTCALHAVPAAGGELTVGASPIGKADEHMRKREGARPSRHALGGRRPVDRVCARVPTCDVN